MVNVFEILWQQYVIFLKVLVEFTLSYEVFFHLIEFLMFFFIKASIEGINSSSKSVEMHHVLMRHFLETFFEIIPFLFNNVHKRRSYLLLLCVLHTGMQFSVFWGWKVPELSILDFDFDFRRVNIWISKHSDDLGNYSIDGCCLKWVDLENVPSFHL